MVRYGLRLVLRWHCTEPLESPLRAESSDRTTYKWRQFSCFHVERTLLPRPLGAAGARCHQTSKPVLYAKNVEYDTCINVCIRTPTKKIKIASLSIVLKNYLLFLVNLERSLRAAEQNRGGDTSFGVTTAGHRSLCHAKSRRAMHAPLCIVCALHAPSTSITLLTNCYYSIVPTM